MALNKPYAASFDKLYGQLLQLSESSQRIQDTMFQMTKKGERLLPQAWNGFHHFFIKGLYFHYRCQGFVECFLATDNYSLKAIRIWAHQLVYPANDSFKQAMLYLDKARYVPSFAALPEFAELERQLKTFWVIEGQIMMQTNELLGGGQMSASAPASEPVESSEEAVSQTAL
ncbi:hypothetical protein [Paenibacillus sp. UNC451MF]|uniref:hypothetical protein n=1 Tax=Paenibacillus sp. UNC451MF TaxID=1449063 RepID=UPI00048BE9C6|nr:hypothetical protein [Paenibacillus sp. UNC451MF]